MGVKMLMSPNNTSSAHRSNHIYLKESDKHDELSESHALLCSPLHTSRLLRCESNPGAQAEIQQPALTRVLSSLSWIDWTAVTIALLTLLCGIGSFVVGYATAFTVGLVVTKINARRNPQ